MDNVLPNNKRNKRFLSGLIWNYGSVIILAVGGLLFSTIIIIFYDASVLGIFNQIFAWYTLLSQVAACGVHLSVAHAIPLFAEDPKERGDILISAFINTTFTSVLLCVLAFSALELLKGMISSNVINYMWTVLPALLVFSYNKVILCYLNGISYMKEYAVFQGLRNLLIALSLLAMSMFKISGSLLPLCFFVAEFVLFVVGITYLGLKKMLVGRPVRKWIFQHFHFGLLILPGNLILEFNAKIGIICLGAILHNDWLVGIYSFMSMLSDGFYQLFVVARRSINPLIAQHFAANALRDSFDALKEKINKYLMIMSVPCAAFLTFGFYLICLIINRKEYLQALIPLGIIALSIAINSRYIVFGNLLAQSGYPAYESVINLYAAVSNIAVSIILVPFFGLIGAAIATAVSYFVYSLVLRKYALRHLDYRI